MNESTGMFPSFLEIQRKHDELLERQSEIERDTGIDTSAFWLEVQEFVARVRPTGALLDTAHDRRAGQSILNYWGNSLYRATFETLPLYLTPFDPSLAPELPDFPAPYRGLAAFSPEDTDFFFGRERLVQALMTRIAQGERFLAVVGASGSGKSSAVLAGLLPALEAGPQSNPPKRSVAVMVPGTKPLQNLAHVLSQTLQGAGKVSGTDEQTLPPLTVANLVDDPASLLQGLEKTTRVPLVLVVDQFEELFTLCEDEAERSAFIQILIVLIQDNRLPHLVIVSMRIEFIDNVVRLPDLDAIFRPGRVDIYPPDINELRAAIEKPAARVGLQFDEGIVDDLISKILGERAGLPLLQFTLTKLWENRRRNRITREVYTQVGHPLQALERSAESFYQSLLPEDRETLRHILLKLVHFDASQEVTSRRIPIEQLFQGNQSRDRVAWVLNRLVEEERLIKRSTGLAPAQEADGETTQGEIIQVEIAHEALIRNWPRLVGWLEDERHRVRRRQRIGEDAAYWEELGREPGALYSALQLAEAQRVLEESDQPLGSLEKAFLESSQQEIDRAMAEEISRRVELERAQERATQQAHRSRRLVWLVILFFILALIPTALIVIELRMRNSEWKPAANLPSDVVLSLAASPPDYPSRYCIGTRKMGVACSTDGTTWNILQANLPTGGSVHAPEVGLRGISALAIDPENPNLLYIFVWEKGIQRSANAGIDWEPASERFPKQHAVKLTVHGQVVVAIMENLDTWARSLWITQDAGKSWTVVDEFSGMVNDAALILSNGETDTQLLVAGDTGIYASPVGSEWSWHQLIDLPLSLSLATGTSLGDGFYVVAGEASGESRLYFWKPVAGLREVAQFREGVSSLTAHHNLDGSLTAYLVTHNERILSVEATGERHSLGKPPASLLHLGQDITYQVLAIPDATDGSVRLWLAHYQGLLEQSVERRSQ